MPKWNGKYCVVMSAFTRFLTGSRVANIIAALALVVSLVAFGINAYQTNRANSTAEEALRISKDAVPRLALESHVRGSSAQNSIPGKSVTLKMIFELDNTGDVPLRICSTFHQFTTLDGQPIMYFPTYVEPGGEKWSISPGEVHTSDISIPISVEWEITNIAYVAIWFECATRGVVTSATVIGVDLRTGKIVNDAVLGLKELPPMDTQERANRVSLRYGRPTMAPAPDEIPPYVAKE